MYATAPIKDVDMVIPQQLLRAAERDPDRPFLRTPADGESATYGEAVERARQAAARFAGLGVRPGERVVIMAPNCAEAIHWWIGANAIGAVDVTINTAYRGHSLEHALVNSRARVVCVDEPLLAVVAASEPRLPELETVVVRGADRDSWPAFERVRAVPYEELPEAEVDGSLLPGEREIGSVIYTSGTTGPAKGVLMPHAQTHVLATTTVEGLRLREEDVFLCAHPLYHIASKFMAVYATILAGGTLVLAQRFEPDGWLADARREGATVSILHGPMIEMVHMEPPRPDDADNELERILAVPLPAKIGRDFERRFGLRAIETWGMTEINAVCWRPYDEPLRLGSCGRVRDDLYEMRVVDPETDEEVAPGEVGEFAVRPRRPWTTMQGYQGMPERTVEAWRNLWFHTGDLGYVDVEGYAYFTDRAKERIRRRGENISSYEIEAAALAHPDVRECAAVGIDSGFEADDDIKLCAVLARPLAEEAIVRHLARELPHFMVPRYVELVAELPRTPTNKVQKALLREAGVTAETWDRKAAGLSLREIVAAAEGEGGAGA